MIGEQLPVDEVLPLLRRALATNKSAVLQAPPGAGKTTHAPLSLLNEAWLAGRTILLLEPRRLAARAACQRMAHLLGEKPGETVGYRIRFDSRISNRTRIEVLTEGILTRRIQSDPELKDVGLVIFDEFHERHLHADLAMALCLDSQKIVREDLKILVMSATLDGASVSKLLGNVPVITSAGRLHPVAVRYLTREPAGPLPQLVCDTVMTALENDAGDVLVFLAGAWEIRRTQELLTAKVASHADICPLYGDLPWELQERAIQPAPGRRKIVLATPIAETSLTIEGIRIVVDSGYVRVPQFNLQSGLSRLTTMRLSRASSEQRAGRAGRLSPGICYRLWSETTQHGLIPHLPPEIRSTDLSSLALELAAWGVREPGALAWLDPPPDAAFTQARVLLTELEALDADGLITQTGNAMVSLPLHPRLSHMLFKAKDLGLVALACDIAALLSEREILSGESRRSADFIQRLESLWAFRAHGRQGAQSHHADVNACARVNQVAMQFRRIMSCPESVKTADISQVGLLLALAYPDRVALARTPGDSRYLLASGRGAQLPEAEIRLRQPCLVAASLDAGETEGMIYTAAPLAISELRRHFAAHIQNKESVRWDPQQQAVTSRHEQCFGALVLDSKPITETSVSDVREAMIEGIRRMGIAGLPWTREARDWQARVLSMRHWLPEENWPDVSDTALFATLDDWLGPYLDGMTRREHLSRLDLHAILINLLGWELARRLEAEAPTHLTVPSGSRMRLEYIPGESPVLKVKLQEMFGLAETPRVAQGKIPVTLSLLSPARRPIQVTQDLRGFWERTYPEVKKELKGRYPKHPWPDNPWVARATSRARPRRS